MDGVSIREVLTMASNFGISGLVLVIWWLSDRANQKSIQAHQDEVANILRAYRDDVSALKQCYLDNVELVKSWQRIAEEQQNLIIMNSNALATMGQKIDSNQFCPAVRLKKLASGVEVKD